MSQHAHPQSTPHKRTTAPGPAQDQHQHQQPKGTPSPATSAAASVHARPHGAGASPAAATSLTLSGEQDLRAELGNLLDGAYAYTLGGRLFSLLCLVSYTCACVVEGLSLPSIRAHPLYIQAL